MIQDGTVIEEMIMMDAVITESGEIRLVDGFGSVSGTVFNDDGTTASNPTRVTITANGARILTNTDAQGQYFSDFIPQGLFRVDAIEPFTARSGFNTSTIMFQDEAVVVDVNLSGLGTLMGRSSVTMAVRCDKVLMSSLKLPAPLRDQSLLALMN